MEELRELLLLLEKEYPTHDKKGRPTYNDKTEITVGDLKMLLRQLVDE